MPNVPFPPFFLVSPSFMVLYKYLFSHLYLKGEGNGATCIFFTTTKAYDYYDEQHKQRLNKMLWSFLHFLTSALSRGYCQHIGKKYGNRNLMSNNTFATINQTNL